MLLIYLSIGTQGSCIVLQMVGYLSFLKVGPKLLKFLPGNKARDLRNWLQIYGVHPSAASSRLVLSCCSTLSMARTHWHGTVSLSGSLHRLQRTGMRVGSTMW